MFESIRDKGDEKVKTGSMFEKTQLGERWRKVALRIQHSDVADAAPMEKVTCCPYTAPHAQHSF